jgi:hypothetical protein
VRGRVFGVGQGCQFGLGQVPTLLEQGRQVVRGVWVGPVTARRSAGFGVGWSVVGVGGVDDGERRHNSGHQPHPSPRRPLLIIPVTSPACDNRFESSLDDKLPWTRMRQVYRLLGLACRYGDTPVNTACGRALQLDVVSVTKIASMLEKAAENTPTPLPPPVAAGAARFARDPAEFNPEPG